MHRKKIDWSTIAIFAALVTAMPVSFAQDSDETQTHAKATLEKVAASAVEILTARMAQPPAERIPLTLRHAAKCVAIFPSVVKAGLIVAAKRGQGLVSCRKSPTHKWGPPVFYNMSEASIGLQAGVQEASILLLVVDDRGVASLTDEKLTFGGDISLAAGPIGAGKKVNLDSSIVSYSRTEGIFAGIDLGGGSITYDVKANAASYAIALPAKTALFEHKAVPAFLQPLQNALNLYAPATTN